LRILLLSNELFNNEGGIQVYNRHLIKVLIESGHALNIVSINDKAVSGNLKYSVQSSGNYSFLRKPVFVKNVIKQIVVFKPELIICGHVNFSLLCFILSKFSGLPYITLTYGVEVWGLRRLMALGLKHSRLIVAMSNFTRNKILKQLSSYPKDNICILPGTVDTARFLPGPKSGFLMEKLGLKPDDFVILTVARLAKAEKYKGYDRVILALKGLISSYPGIKYILLGGGDDLERAEKLVKDNGLESNVIFAGSCHQDQLADFYNLCDCFVMPSHGEGFGLVFLEALACGKPVIAGNKDASVEALLGGEIGVLVSPDNLAAIREAIEKVIKRELPENLLNASLLREKVINAFGPERFKERVTEIIAHCSAFLTELNKPDSSAHRLVIKPTRGWVAINFKELWDYRELLYFLAWKDLKIRYRQTVLGVAWSVVQPAMSMVVFTLFFGKMAKIPSDGIPYPIFSYSGLLIWVYFSATLLNSSMSLVSNTNLITKVYFPRLIIPFSTSITGLVDYLIALGLLIIMMFYYGIFPHFSIVLLPFCILMAVFAATGIGLWMSALYVRYRDIRYVIPFFVQLLLFLTPVIYPTSSIPEKYRWLISLNPISGVIDLHRACLLGYKSINWLELAISSTVILVIIISGTYYFRRTERYFADYI